MKEYNVFNDRTPAERFDSLPIGNGRMGAMLMCGVSLES